MPIAPSCGRRELDEARAERDAERHTREQLSVEAEASTAAAQDELRRALEEQARLRESAAQADRSTGELQVTCACASSHVHVHVHVHAALRGELQVRGPTSLARGRQPSGSMSTRLGGRGHPWETSAPAANTRPSPTARDAGGCARIPSAWAEGLAEAPRTLTIGFAHRVLPQATRHQLEELEAVVAQLRNDLSNADKLLGIGQDVASAMRTDFEDQIAELRRSNAHLEVAVEAARREAGELAAVAEAQPRALRAAEEARAEALAALQAAKDAGRAAMREAEAARAEKRELEAECRRLQEQRHRDLDERTGRVESLTAEVTARTQVHPCQPPCSRDAMPPPPSLASSVTDSSPPSVTDSSPPSVTDSSRPMLGSRGAGGTLGAPAGAERGTAAAGGGAGRGRAQCRAARHRDRDACAAGRGTRREHRPV